MNKETATTDELVRRLRNDEAGPAGINHAKTMRTHAAKLECALRGLLYVIDIDELIPESVSYMRQAREALTLPPIKPRREKQQSRRRAC